MTTVLRVYNFSAGPAVLPLPVLEEIQRDMIALSGVGMSILEISHRSKTFESILAKAEADIRALANIPSNYKVLFLQGGASLQFSMVPMNLLGPGQTADYIDSGSWADKAVKEAKRVGTVNVAATRRAAPRMLRLDIAELATNREQTAAQSDHRAEDHDEKDLEGTEEHQGLAGIEGRGAAE